VSRPTPLDGPAADARATLPEPDTAAFDRLAHAVLASANAPLGPLLRAQLPGTAGVRWLRQENLPPTTRASRLTSGQWLSLFSCWTAVHRAPSAGGPGGRKLRGHPSTHGHAPGAAAIPRWGQ
jgi:hypothetical protein